MVSIIHGPIERIDVPGMLCASLNNAALFSKDMVIVELPAHLTKQKSFRLVVHFRDQIDDTFVIDLMFLTVSVAQDRSGFARQAFNFRKSRSHYFFNSSIVL